MQAEESPDVMYVKSSLVSQALDAKRSPSELVGGSAPPKVEDLRKEPGVHSLVSCLKRMVWHWLPYFDQHLK